LDRRHHRCLICLERLANRSVIVDIVGHRIEYGREGHQRYEGRIEALLLGRGSECCAGLTAILLQPIVDIDDLLRVPGGRAYLREQGVRIKSNRCEQLFQLIAARRVLGLSHPTEKEETRAPFEQTRNSTSQHILSPCVAGAA
jgi:hypothetical protein